MNSLQIIALSGSTVQDTSKALGERHMCWTWHFYTDVEPKVKNVGSSRSVIKHFPTMSLSWWCMGCMIGHP